MDKRIKYEMSAIGKTAKDIINELNSNIVCFKGQVGAGKTTLIKEIIKELGAIESANSPTFGLINEHRDVKGKLLAYHADCYRIESLEEALDIGFEEYLNTEQPIFIEWPERINQLLPGNRTEIKINYVSQFTRELEIKFLNP